VVEDLIVAIGLPVVILTVISVVLVVGAMTLGSVVKYQKVQPYTIDQKWEHEPLLFSATDVTPVAPGYHGHGHDDLIGGSASGKW
jgi:heme/copper-type cytochrome/quinol oxidase subunit 2